MAKGYRKYSPEFREEVVKLVIDTSRAITDVAREYGVHDTTLGNWVREYKEKHGGEAEAHRAFIARRRATRPSEEYRTPTEEEWDAFLAHFEKRKVSIGHLRPDPAQRGRLEEIRD